MSLRPDVDGLESASSKERWSSSSEEDVMGVRVRIDWSRAVSLREKMFL